MKSTTISVNVYDIGDVIELNANSFSLAQKKRSWGRSERGLIVAVNKRLDHLFSYKVIADSGKMFTFTPVEQGCEKYIGHIDLGLLYGGEQDG